MKEKITITAHDKLIFKALKSEFGVGFQYIRPMPDEPHRNVANYYFLTALLNDKHQEAREFIHLLTKDLKKFIVDKYPKLLDL